MCGRNFCDCGQHGHSPKPEPAAPETDSDHVTYSVPPPPGYDAAWRDSLFGRFDHLQPPVKFDWTKHPWRYVDRNVHKRGGETWAAISDIVESEAGDEVAQSDADEDFGSLGKGRASGVRPRNRCFARQAGEYGDGDDGEGDEGYVAESSVGGEDDGSRFSPRAMRNARRRSLRAARALRARDFETRLQSREDSVLSTAERVEYWRASVERESDSRLGFENQLGLSKRFREPSVDQEEAVKRRRLEREFYMRGAVEWAGTELELETEIDVEMGEAASLEDGDVVQQRGAESRPRSIWASEGLDIHEQAPAPPSLSPHAAPIGLEPPLPPPRPTDEWLQRQQAAFRFENPFPAVPTALVPPSPFPRPAHHAHDPPPPPPLSPRTVNALYHQYAFKLQEESRVQGEISPFPVDPFQQAATTGAPVPASAPASLRPYHPAQDFTSLPHHGPNGWVSFRSRPDPLFGGVHPGTPLNIVIGVVVDEEPAGHHGWVSFGSRPDPLFGGIHPGTPLNIVNGVVVDEEPAGHHGWVSFRSRLDPLFGGIHPGTPLNIVNGVVVEEEPMKSAPPREQPD